MKLYCVVVDTAGAWEAECVYSIWDSPEEAAKEIARLRSLDISLGCYGGAAKVVPVILNTPSDTWIGDGPEKT